nr:MAG TPA: hypothetical protein [Caudoviricetes sp.]
MPKKPAIAPRIIQSSSRPSPAANAQRLREPKQ